MTVSTPPSYNSSPPSTPHGKLTKTEYPAIHTIPSTADLSNAYEPHPGTPWSIEIPPYHAGEDPFPSNVRRSMGLFLDPTTIYQAERRYAQAILASMPLDNEEPNWLNAVYGAAGAPSDQAGYYFPEENMVALQLRQYSEMFICLSRMYENSLKQPSLTPVSERIVRRGGIILAAVRLLAGRSHEHHSPASGIDPRNTSQVSVWGWKPYREIDLAERVSERRRLRALVARAEARERKLQSKRGLQAVKLAEQPIGGVRVTQPVSSDPKGEKRAMVYKTWAQQELENSIERRARSTERMARLSRFSAAVRNTPLTLEHIGDATASSPEELPYLTFPRRPATINWTLPTYDAIPTLHIPLPPDKPARARRGSWLRRRRNAAPPEILPLLHPVRQLPSPSVSPKSTPSPSTFKNWQQPSSTNDTDGEQPSMKASTPLTLTSPGTLSSNSRSFARSGNLRLQKLKAAFRNAIPSVKRLSWSSTSGSSPTASVLPPCTQSVDASPAMAQVPSRRSWLGKTQASKAKEIAFEKLPTDPPIHRVSNITLLANTTTTQERVELVSPFPPISDMSDSDETLTRTEREYQELLAALQQLKRELRLERDAARRRRSRSRGRRSERASNRRLRNGGRSLSGETVKTTEVLGEMPPSAN